VITTTPTQASNFSKKWIFCAGCGLLAVAFLAAVLIAAGLYLNSLIVTIGPEERGVIISPHEPTGFVERPLMPGRNMLRPLESVEIYWIARETYSSASANPCQPCDSTAALVRTTDGADLVINYQVIYSIDAEKVLQIHKDWQHRYPEEFVARQSKQVTQEVASHCAAQEIALTDKAEIQAAIMAALEPDFSAAGFILWDFIITTVDLEK
jgi:regulator of protease activity HflC (stomatin/prohibitin superfamily)